MLVIEAENVNGAFKSAVDHILRDDNWHRIAPRDGLVTMEYDEPVTTIYRRPWRRVLFSEVRDANPFFHLMEALWMLAGRSDATWISQFSSNIGDYAEDDGHFHGAYGYRWRGSSSSSDQLYGIARLINGNNDTRRAVLSMWDAEYDLGADKKDLPCNTHVYFKKRAGRLNMTVCCRSNDIIWGCYGANAVHFSVLQEYMAALTGSEMGLYYHISDSWHYYVDNPTIKKLKAGAAYGMKDYYAGWGHTPVRINTTAMINETIDQWDEDLRIFFTDTWDSAVLQYDDVFFRRVAHPMRVAWRLYKEGEIEGAIIKCRDIMSQDWGVACTQWMQRRKNHVTKSER